MTKSDSKPPSKRITELDGLRGIAILLVLLWHYLPCLLHPAKGTALGYLCQALSLTWSGVDLFFVLSGFLIAGILLENKEAANYFSVFYLRRSCRIFPVYYLVFGGFFVARALVAGKGHFGWLLGNPMPMWSYLTFTQNIVFSISPGRIANWFGVTWSLGVEEQFYLFLPLLVWLLPRRVIPPVFFVLAASAVALRALWPGAVAFMGMPWRADSLLTGALLACGVKSQNFSDRIASNKWLLRAVFGALLLGMAVFSTSIASKWAQPGEVLVHLWMALFYGALLLLALMERDGWFGCLLRNRVLVWFGAISYGIYMFHQGALGLLQGIAGNDPPVIRTSQDAMITLAALFVTILLAALSFFGMERYILRWAHRFHYQTKSPPGKALDHSLAAAEGLS